MYCKHLKLNTSKIYFLSMSPLQLTLHRVPILVNSTTTSLNQKIRNCPRFFLFFISINNQPPNLWIPSFSYCSNLIPPFLSFHSHCLSSSHCSTFRAPVYFPTKVLPLPPTDKLLIKHQSDHIIFLRNSCPKPPPQLSG